MTVIKRQRSDNYAMVPNEVANDDRLSFEARGLLIYLLAKPHDWVVSIVDLQKQGQIGRDKTYKLLNELIDTGYIDREREHDLASHRVVGFNYTIYDLCIRTKIPFPENTEVAEPLTGLPDTENQDTYKEKILTKTTPQPPLAGGPSFELLWEKWPGANRGRRDNAEGSFRKLNTAERASAVQAAEATVRALSLRKQRIPAIVAYLRQSIFSEFDGAPEVDFDGDFVIRPGRPEWGEWLGATRREFGEEGVKRTLMLGYMVRKSRWPPVYENKPEKVVREREAA